MAVKEPALDFEQLYQLASREKVVGQLEKELYLLKRDIKGDYELKTFLEDSFVPVSLKKKLVAEIFPAQTSALFKGLVFYLLGIGRAEWFHRLSDIFSQLVAAKTGQMIIEVFSADPLTENFIGKIEGELGQLLRSGLIIKNIVNPDLLGGIMVKLGDKIIDASLRQKLNLLKQALV